MNSFMEVAIKEAKEGISKGHGGPFGSVIVKNGRIVAQEHNKVLKNNDPTCHGEIAAIRSACKKLKTFDLSDCELYTTGEPCPMCLCACLWANIEKIYYGCSIKENEEIGFRDNQFANIINDNDKMGSYLQRIGENECKQLFNQYKKIKNKQNY